MFKRYEEPVTFAWVTGGKCVYKIRFGIICIRENKGIGFKLHYISVSYMMEK